MPAPMVIVVGSINTDLVVRVPHLPQPGVTVIGSQFLQVTGGKGANQAVAAARASQSSAMFIAAAGNDPFGSAALADLSREPLDCNHVARIAGVASGVAVIMVDEQGENCIAVSPGANAHLSPQHIQQLPDAVFHQAKVLLASLEVPIPTIQAALQRARAFGLTTILNPAPVTSRDDVLDLCELVDILTPNEHEAAQLLSRNFRGPIEALTAADDLRTLGPGRVVITLGSDGAAAVSSAGATHVPGIKVAVADTTAAGDAYSGSLAVAIAEEQTWFDTLRFAAAASTLSVTRTGAIRSLPSRAEIEAWLGDH